MTNSKPIFLDYNSTTPVDPRVLETMLPYFTNHFGNAASKTHQFGWLADEAVVQARQRIATLINVEPGEIVFTSGATEAINLAIKGVYEKYATKGNHIISVATEHKAVIDCLSKLEQRGAKVTYLPVDEFGLINLNQLEDAITDQTILVSVMLANNEIGVLQPIKEIGNIVHRHKSIFMSDATQAIGKISVDVQNLGIDLMPMSAHKMYGPKGVGALYIRRKKPRVYLESQIDGGGHEKGLRSGTLNVPGIVGMGKTCELASEELVEDGVRIEKLRDQLEAKLLELGNVKINSNTVQRLPNTSNLSFGNIDSQLLLKKLSNKVAIASGSACTSALMEPSYVLKALGLTDKVAYASIRFSLGKFTTEEEINTAIELVKAGIKDC